MRVVSRRGAIQLLNSHKGELTKQQYKTLKGQTENDIEGCIKGLKKLLKAKGITLEV